MQIIFFKLKKRVLGAPSDSQIFFQKTQCTKNSFPFCVALGVARGHTCQWLSDVYYYGPGLLRSWWLVKILEHSTKWIIQLFFGALLALFGVPCGCSGAAVCFSRLLFCFCAWWIYIHSGLLMRHCDFMQRWTVCDVLPKGILGGHSGT